MYMGAVVRETLYACRHGRRVVWMQQRQQREHHSALVKRNRSSHIALGLVRHTDDFDFYHKNSGRLALAR